MTALALLLAMAVTSAAPQTPSVHKWEELNRVCGRVVRDSKPRSDSYQTPEYPLGISKATVQLHPWHEGSDCRSDPSAVAETRTKKDGMFQIKGAAFGTYWLEVSSKGKQWSTVIRYTGASRDFGSCSDHLFVAQKNRTLKLERLIRVD